ncbi:disease resistance protein RPM1-like [Malus domestica]|uniref:disease resistance protein RPM1-like n=1 Tax=Malus domestica TaxID=3750 RepID=UPI003974994E
MHQPRESHLQTVKRILRYLKGTLELGLWFSKTATPLCINAFSDADWAGCHLDRRSTGGFCIFLGHFLLSWSAKKQPTVARSSIEAEYRSLANSAAELTWICKLLIDVGLKLPSPPKLWCDNIFAMHLAKNLVFHAQTKHVELDYHYIREKVLSKELSVHFIFYFIATLLQIAYQVSKAKMESAAALLIGKISAILENEASSIAAVHDEVDELKLELISITIYFPKNLWHGHRIAKKLQKITKKIKAIPERNERYRVSTIEGTSSDSVPRWVKNKAESSLYIMEDELIGIEDKKQTLMGLLMNGEENEMVVSVVGMGGSGKTTLVANTFNNENVKQHFDCYAWITVSQTYVIEDLFKQMIKKFHEGRKEAVPEHLNSMSYEELLKMLSTYLKSKRYLVVLDDVWDIKLWQEIRIPLLNRHHGSRIMLTTRKKDIAFYSFEVESRSFEIEPLENNEAWELFSKKAFSSYDNKSCPPELESLAWKLVEKCEGLPLAVVTLSGLMSSKSPVSYIVPIKRKRLIRLWIAEGFVEPIDGVTPEEVAEGYVVELIVRSMLQVENDEAGGLKACKMHDLVRELALLTSKMEKFGATCVGREIIDKAEIRRLSIQTTEREINSCTGMSELCCFLVFGVLKKLPSGFKLLRVLDVQDAPIDRFPDELVYLFNLRYLNLKRTLIDELPESIGRLLNLQTLNICHSKIRALPKTISKLVNLRHLMMYCHTGDWAALRCVNGTKAASDLSKLQKLQVLQSVESEGKIIKGIRNMTQLTSLGITIEKGAKNCVSLEAS